MADVIEVAESARAKCRVCKKPIAKGAYRFGERVLSAFSDGDETTLWYHVECAAEKRPFKFGPTLAKHKKALPDRRALEATLKVSTKACALESVLRADRAPTGRAKCQQCKKLITKDELRLAIDRGDDPFMRSTYFVHARCGRAYVGGDGLAARLKTRSKTLSKADWAELAPLL